MFMKMNIWSIVRGHFATFQDARTKKISKIEVCLYLFLPFVLSFLIVKFGGFSLDKENANIFLTAFSIFAGLLFNMLLLIFDILDKTKNGNEMTEEKKMRITLFRETFLNISFTVLVSVCIVIMLLVFVLFMSHLNSPLYKIFDITLTLKGLISFLTVALIVMFLMSFLMILKRFNILLSREL